VWAEEACSIALTRFELSELPQYDGMNMGPLVKFELSLSQLRQRNSSLKSRLETIREAVSRSSREQRSGRQNEELIAAAHRDCSGILASLRSLLEVVASSKPKPNPDMLNQVRLLKLEHEALLDEINVLTEKLRSNSTGISKTKTSNSAAKKKGHAGSYAQTAKESRRDNFEGMSLEHVLDREASLRAQYDILQSKHGKLLHDLADAHEKISQLDRTRLDLIARQKDESSSISTELEKVRRHAHIQLASIARFASLLLLSNKDLRRKLNEGALATKYALVDEMQMYSEEEVFLNPERIAFVPLGKTQLEKRAKQIAGSGLFDYDFYASQFSSPPPSGMNAVVHFLTTGWREGKDPHPLFSVVFYLMRNQYLTEATVDPLTHYIEEGSAAFLDPHPLFIARHYSQKVSNIHGAGTWLAHFLTSEQSPPSPHPVFNADWYANGAGLSTTHCAQALIHYLKDGWIDDCPLSPLFDFNHYRHQFEETTEIGEPYLHFAIFGAPHGVSPHPLFDTRFYLSGASDFDPLQTDPLFHYLTIGERAGRHPSPYFDPKFYCDNYLNGKGERSPLWHFLTEGKKANNDPCREFDLRLYQKLIETFSLGEVAEKGVEHFIGQGISDVSIDAVINVLTKADVAELPGQSISAALPSQSAARTGEQLISKQYPGKVKRREGHPNVLVVAHIAGEHLFGSERSFLDMVDAIAKIAKNVFVVLPRNVPDYTNALRQLCQHVYVIDYKWWRSGEPISQNAVDAFRYVVESNEVDVVHVNTIMLREALEAARVCNVQSVVHVRELIQHDVALQQLIGLSPDEIVAEVRGRADWVIGNSAITASTFNKEGQTFSIPNTIDIDGMDLSNDIFGGQIRFGLISSNIPKKGLSDVVDLARLSELRGLNAIFVVIGPETELVRQLRKDQEEGNGPACLEFAGYAESPRDAVSKVNVVLNFSHFAESFGRTVLEAMAARRPVICYKWGALVELVDHKRTGFLVPFKKVEQALPYIEMFCRNPKLIHEFGERGRQVATAKFGLSRYRASIAEAYARILEKSRQRVIGSAQPIVRQAKLETLKTREEKPRVAYFCWHFPVPSETFVLNEIEALLRDGWDVIVFCKQIPYKDFKPSFDVKFERVASHEDLARRLIETSRTIVHAHFVYPVVTDMVWPACEKAQIPFTFIAHAQDIFRYDNDKKNRLAEIGASKWCRALFTLSRFHLNFVVERGFPLHKVIINPNAVDTVRFAAVYRENRETRGTRRIVAIHRFVKKKGLELLIRAAPLVADLDVEIQLYGYGDLEEEYRRLIVEVGAANVSIGGPLTQDEVVETLGSADLFASPSIRVDNGDMDGIPTSIVEAMAAGVPILTTNVAGIPDLVCDGVTGIVADPTPESVADGIRRFCAMPSLKVRGIVRAAAERVKSRHDVNRLTRVLKRVWRNDTVDIVIVSWNNLADLKMVVDRILLNTALPYHLIICDNQSQREPVPEYLDDLWRSHERVTVIHNGRNAMVGPGTNMALAQGTSDYAIYICGREGISFANGWEIPFVHALDENPKAGLAGSIGYSPSYLFGSQFPTGIELFDKFRNKVFATSNPERKFGHVQGGLFALRRSMVDEIGGFSEEVPHSYTDVEYSFYVESRGWGFCEVPGVLALFNKSRPTLSQRFDETVMVAHPVLPDELGRYDAVVAGRLKHCNVCDWFGEAFHANGVCPSCGTSPLDRSLYRWLSEGILMYRRLPALSLGLGGAMAKVWEAQFQGQRLASAELVAEVSKNGRLSNRGGTFHVALMRSGPLPVNELPIIVGEIKRLLTRDGTALFQIDVDDAQAWDRHKNRLSKEMARAGFVAAPDVVYASHAIEYSHVPLCVFTRSQAP